MVATIISTYSRSSGYVVLVLVRDKVLCGLLLLSDSVLPLGASTVFSP